MTFILSKINYVRVKFQFVIDRSFSLILGSRFEEADGGGRGAMVGRMAPDDAGRRREIEASGTEELLSHQSSQEVGRERREDGDSTGWFV